MPVVRPFAARFFPDIFGMYPSGAEITSAYNTAGTLTADGPS
jgi:hypothetical protein